MTTIGAVTNRIGVPLVSGGSRNTGLNITAGASSATRRTVVAVTVEATIRTAAGSHPNVLATVDLTNLCAGAGASLRTRYTVVTLVVVATAVTGCRVPGVSRRSAEAATSLKVSARHTTLASARRTLVTEGVSALTVVIGIGTLVGTDGV